jgi:hypothetical protein
VSKGVGEVEEGSTAIPFLCSVNEYRCIAATGASPCGGLGAGGREGAGRRAGMGGWAGVDEGEGARTGKGNGAGAADLAAEATVVSGKRGQHRTPARYISPF